MEIRWPKKEEVPKDDTTLRHVQLEVRLAEFEACLETLRKINNGGTSTAITEACHSVIPTPANASLETLSILSPGWNWKDWKDFLDVDGCVIMGHSFGGSAAVCLDHFSEIAKKLTVNALLIFCLRRLWLARMIVSGSVK